MGQKLLLPSPQEEDLPMKSLLKRNALKHLICIALVVIITSGFIPLNTWASTYKNSYRVTALAQKKTVTQQADTERYYSSSDTYVYTSYLYKINVPANGYLRIASSASSKEIRIYKSINNKNNINSQDWIVSLSGSRTYYRILPRGYYYIHADPGTKFNWSFNRKKTVYNYCRAKAVGLKAAAKTGVYFTCGYEYDRWYRVTLTRNKTITVTFNRLDTDSTYLNGFYIYDSQGKNINCPELTKTSYRTGTLRKGTYYICVWSNSYDDEDYEYSGRIVQVMWR